MEQFTRLMLRSSAIAATFLLLTAGAVAQIPRTMSFQGTIASGNVTPNSTPSLTFRIYTSSAGGTAIWQETITTQLTARFFSVILGNTSSNPLNISFDQQYWIGITVGSGTEMTPRVQLTSAPYALDAARIGGFAVATETPSDGEALMWDGDASQWKSMEIDPCGNECYIHNQTTLQEDANFNISGSGTAGELRLQGAGGYSALTAGDQGSTDITYTLPTTTPSSDGQVLSSTTDGVMSWIASATGLQNFTESVNASTPNETAPVAQLMANNEATDVDVALTPKGAGALTMQVADDDITGGNKRGAYAIDLQRERDDPALVASGEFSILIGGYNSAAVGDYSIAIGSNSRAGAYATTAIAGAHAEGEGAVGIGNEATARGHHSVALGYRAHTNGSDPYTSEELVGDYATAIGYSTYALGDASTAMGSASAAVAQGSTAMGVFTYAAGERSTAMGNGSETYGFASTAMGASVAHGDYSTAMGASTTSGHFSTAMGKATLAWGDQSTAMGSSASTNNHSGSFVYGDNTTNTMLQSSADNQFSVRAAGGYRFFSDASTTASQGVFIAPGGNVGLGISSPSEKLDVGGNINASGSLRIGGGATITNVLTASATLDFSATSENSSADLTITVAGASVGDAVFLGAPNGSVLANTSYTAWVSSTGTVTVRFNNYGGGSGANPSSGTFRVSVMKF